MVFHCSYCSFHCRARLDLIKHVFSSHSIEPTFTFVCAIKGCPHCFKFGATFSSFKSHCNRKHPNWQQYVDDATDPDPPASALHDVPMLEPLSNLDVSIDNDGTELEHQSIESINRSTSINTEQVSMLQVQKSSALFLLSCKERFKLPQAAINFAVGAVNAIVNDVCDLAKQSIEQALSTNTSASLAIQQCRDPFASLETEYRQTKFYREVFGLVVSMIYRYCV